MRRAAVLGLLALALAGCGTLPHASFAGGRPPLAGDPTYTATCVYVEGASGAGSLSVDCPAQPTDAPTPSPTASSSPSSSPTPSSSPSDSPTPPVQALKPPETGLEVTSVKAARDQGVALEVGWSTLEPTAGKFDFGVIDQALADPDVPFLKLRIMAGFSAPGWLPGGVHPISTRNGNGTVPLYWTAPVQQAWAGLVSALGARYDADPKLLTVTNSLCITTYAEPFIKGGPTAGADLYALGDNYAGELDCMEASMDALVTAFPHTRISTALHDAWQEPVKGGIATSWPDEHSLIQSWRASYGGQMVYQDNGLSAAKATCDQSAPTAADADSQWCYLAAIAAPKGAQQGCGPAGCTDQQTQVVEPALHYGLCFVEHATWSGLTASQASSDDAALAADCDGA